MNTAACSVQLENIINELLQSPGSVPSPLPFTKADGVPSPQSHSLQAKPLLHLQHSDNVKVYVLERSHPPILQQCFELGWYIWDLQCSIWLLQLFSIKDESLAL